MLTFISKLFDSVSCQLLYITLIRSQLTYCSRVWRPFLIKDISLLESVQRRATMWILNDYKSDYKSRLATLCLLPLMMTYKLNDLKFFIKSLHQALDYVSFSRSSRAYGARLRHCHARNNKSRHFYFDRLPHLWNGILYNPLIFTLCPCLKLSLLSSVIFIIIL